MCDYLYNFRVEVKDRHLEEYLQAKLALCQFLLGIILTVKSKNIFYYNLYT
jgi:hypothetical protein